MTTHREERRVKTIESLAREIAAEYGHQEYEVLAWLDEPPTAEVDDAEVEELRSAYATDQQRIIEERS